ncbi:hypothetical protein [Streptomyces sp. G45]|uniref:hypothetical protein n=1 Tax=Streptomyces sp. G45 TaxID=3406627 RepID=UPI003C21FDF0
MTDRRYETPGEDEKPIPRDPPDQQAGADADPWEGSAENADRPDGQAPSVDQPGARRQDEERSDTVHPEHPDPEESTD